MKQYKNETEEHKGKYQENVYDKIETAWETSLRPWSLFFLLFF